ncbi:MAG: class I SAM-dependent methyltransferase [Acidobacteria bacterium]|nr:class I SAM-dependent methyltransferase [Acidobacteriota bacterium]
MSQAETVKPYRWLAQYYDEIFASMRSPADEARERLLSRIMSSVDSACDLACGTGTTALILARKGITMYAVDLSPLMCRLARKKASRAGLPLHILQADMRSFRLPKAVDLITCEFDALNHVPHRRDLRKVARAVARALRPGGHFFFDVNNSLGFKRYWTGAVWFEKPGVALVMRNGHSREADRAWSDVEWFIRHGRLWRRYHERVEEVCWDADEIRLTLQETGFDQVRAWDAAPFFKDNPLIGPGCRTFYLARKGGSPQPGLHQSSRAHRTSIHPGSPAA